MKYDFDYILDLSIIGVTQYAHLLLLLSNLCFFFEKMFHLFVP